MMSFPGSLVLASIALLVVPSPSPVDEEPPITVIACGGSDTVTPDPGTLVTGVGATAAAAKADLASKLGLVCSVCAGAGCQLSVGSIGSPGSDLYEGNGGSMIYGGSPRGPYLITVQFGIGGHCTASCSPCT